MVCPFLLQRLFLVFLPSFLIDIWALFLFDCFLDCLDPVFPEPIVFDQVPSFVFTRTEEGVPYSSGIQGGRSIVHEEVLVDLLLVF